MSEQKVTRVPDPVPPPMPKRGDKHVVNIRTSDNVGDSEPVSAWVEGLPFSGTGKTVEEAMTSLIRLYVDVIIARTDRMRRLEEALQERGGVDD